LIDDDDDDNAAAVVLVVLVVVVVDDDDDDDDDDEVIVADCSEHGGEKQRAKMFRHRSDPYRRSAPTDVRELPVNGKRPLLLL